MNATEKYVVRLNFLLFKVLGKGYFTVPAYVGGSAGQMFCWSSAYL